MLRVTVFESTRKGVRIGGHRTIGSAQSPFIISELQQAVFVHTGSSVGVFMCMIGDWLTFSVAVKALSTGATVKESVNAKQESQTLTRHKRTDV